VATYGHIVHPPDDMCMEAWWNNTDKKKIKKEFGENPVAVPLCPPQIPHGLTKA
jgi:hypothetical protein